MPSLLIYVVPILAGIVGSRYLSRLANFCVMIAVFQFDVTLLASLLSGEPRLRLLVPYTVLAIIPAMAGIVGRRYLGNIANVGVIIVVCYVGAVLLAYPYGNGQLRLLPPPGAIFVSAGSLVPPLVFILVAIVAIGSDASLVPEIYRLQ